MIGTFFMKYRFPLAYAATKVLANHIHAVMVKRPVRPSRRCEGSPQAPYETIDLAPLPPPQARELIKRVSKPRPAATKQNGGLRGSSASRWR